MRCPKCQTDNGADVPVRSCRCGYSSFKSEKKSLLNPYRGSPGTELKSLIPSYFASGSCGCDDYAAKMDRWGVEGCRERQEEIINHLVDQAKKTKLGSISETIDRIVATRWVNQAIQRAEDEQRRHVRE